MSKKKSAKKAVSLNSELDQEQGQGKNKKLIITLTIFFTFLLVFLFVVSPIFAYEFIYQDKIYAGVQINNINVGGLTKIEAINLLNQYIDNLNNKGINFSYQNDNYNLGLTAISPNDPDLAHQIVIFEVEKMVDQAFDYGRTSTLSDNLITQFQSAVNKKQVGLNAYLDKNELNEILKTRFSQYEDPAQNAQLTFINDQLRITQEKAGFVLDYDKAINNLNDNLNFISLPDIELQTISSQPEISKKQAEKNINLINKILAKEKIILQYQDKQWEITNKEFKIWLSLYEQDNQVKINFDNELLQTKLEQLSQEINILPKDAKIIMEDEKVTSFEPHGLGLELDLDQSVQIINKDFFTHSKLEIDLIVNEIEPKIKTESVNNLGIKEIIGVGISDFSGSSKNRIGNITTASTKLHGMLIEPDEEFSLVERIGDVTAATGYFSEWVIKGDRTIKEYGGGLCQIATTTFRAAIETGLPIVERKPHSYIVSYYKPIGYDAAIYGPHPDVRFINDTGHHILFQTEMNGTELKFTFWGTSDGRQVEVTIPEVYNWRGAPAAKNIVNPNLEPGTKILKEHARKGADAHFYRYLTLPGKEKQEEVWRSHYVSWPAIYEVGPEEQGEEGSVELENTEANNSESTDTQPDTETDNTEE